MRTKSRGSSQPRLHPVTSTDGDNRNTGGAFFFFAPFLLHHFLFVYLLQFLFIWGMYVWRREDNWWESALSFPLVVSLGLLPSYLQEKPAPEFAP